MDLAHGVFCNSGGDSGDAGDRRIPSLQSQKSTSAFWGFWGGELTASAMLGRPFLGALWELPNYGPLRKKPRPSMADAVNSPPETQRSFLHGQATHNAQEKHAPASPRRAKYHRQLCGQPKSAPPGARPLPPSPPIRRQGGRAPGTGARQSRRQVDGPPSPMRHV